MNFRRKAPGADDVMAGVHAAMKRASHEELALQLRILSVLKGERVTWSDDGHELSGTATGEYLGAGSGINTGQAQFLLSGGGEVWTWPKRVAVTGRFESTSTTVMAAMHDLAACEFGAELLEETLGRMGMDRTWVAEVDGEVVWWPSPLAQRLDSLRSGNEVRLTATTDLISVSSSRLGSEGVPAIEAILSDVNYRFGSRSAWWFDEEDAVVRTTTSVVVHPDARASGTQRIGASAVLQAWEAMNLATLFGDAAPGLGVPCLSEHPRNGPRGEVDPILRMVHRDLHATESPPLAASLLAHLAELPLWSSCRAGEGQIVATPIGCASSAVRIWLEDRHATFRTGVCFEGLPGTPVLGAAASEMAGALNRLAVLDLAASLGGAWSVNERQELVYRSFWPATFAEHPSLLTETAREVAVQCAMAEQFA